MGNGSKSFFCEAGSFIVTVQRGKGLGWVEKPSRPRRSATSRGFDGNPTPAPETDIGYLIGANRT